ncbi:MAG: PF20097 family protein [Enterocloster sp.]
MKCPYCNQEMEAGFLTSDARLHCMEKGAP